MAKQISKTNQPKKNTKIRSKIKVTHNLLTVLLPALKDQFKKQHKNNKVKYSIKPLPLDRL